MLVYDAIAITQSYAQLDRHYIINIRPSVDYDCEIGDYVHVAPRATVLGGVKIGEGSWIGAGAVVKQYVTVGKHCMVGAGSVVLHDVIDGTTVVGVPAEQI